MADDKSKPVGDEGAKKSAAGKSTLAAFMAGLRQEENGGSYTFDINSAGAHGAYQIVDWNGWARAAGVNPSDHSAAAQDAVAEHQIKSYLKQFNGNYAMVAAAWLSGAGGAVDWEHGGDPVDSNGTHVSQYVPRVLGFAGMNAQQYKPPGAKLAVENVQPVAAGGGGGGGVVMETSASPKDIKGGLDSLGFASALINSNKSLSQAYHQIIADNIHLDTTAGQDRAKLILQNTAWFQNHSKSQREFDELKFADPKEFQSQIAQQVASLKATAGQSGVQLDPAELQKIATMSLRNGLNTQQVGQVLASHFDYNPKQGYTGTAGQAIQSIQQQADSYYVPITNGRVQNLARQAIAGQLDPTSLADQFQQQALSAYPYLKEQIQGQGQTVAQVMDPYKQMMASTLELDENGIKNQDPTLMKALQGQDQSGQMGLTPLWKFQQQLMNDPRWMNTTNAKQTLVGAATGVLQAMGLKN